MNLVKLDLGNLRSVDINPQDVSAIEEIDSMRTKLHMRNGSVFTLSESISAVRRKLDVRS